MSAGTFAGIDDCARRHAGKASHRSASPARPLVVAAAAIGALAGFSGLLVLGCWVVGLEFVRSLLIGAQAMKANTALCIAIAGVALW